MKLYKLAFLGVILISLVFTSCNKNTEIETVDDFKKYIDEEMENQNIPALSVLIFENDEILYEDYFGQSNIEQNLPLEKNHIFLLASISKTITATALLTLYDKGDFQLDDKINDYLPFEVNIPNSTTDVTFRMLLTHTSAIADGPALDDQYYYGEDSPVALEYFMENYFTPGGEFYDESQNFHDFEPGEYHEYSNVGSALIGVLVEQISGKDFNTYCKENIFTPLGMSSTFWRLDEISQTIVTPYILDGDYVALQNYTFTDYPNGGLRSNVTDMHKFLGMLANGGTFNGVKILESNTVQQMTTPQIPDIDNEVGLHLFIFGGELQLWGHDGGEEGVSTIMAFNKDTKIGALIFTNMSDVNLDEMLKEAYNLGLKL